MRSVISLLFLASIRLLAQPNICYFGQVSSGCSYPAFAGTPTLQTFMAGLNSSADTMRAVMAPLPQPKIGVYLMVVPAQTHFANGDTIGCNAGNNCVFSNALPSNNSQGLEAWISAAVDGACSSIGNGVSGVYWEFNPLLGTQAAGYSGSATPADPTFLAYQLAQQILALKYAASLGCKIRLGVLPEQQTLNACGLTFGSVTAAQVYNCLDPMDSAYVAEVAANVTIEAAFSVNEPQGGTALWTGVTFDPSDFDAIAYNGCDAIYSADPIPCGGAFTAGDAGGAGCGVSGTAYITCYLANISTHHIGYLFVETYGGKNPATYASSMATVVAQCPLAQAVNDPDTGQPLKCGNNEGDPTRWVPSTSPDGGEANAIIGCSDPLWDLWGVNTGWALIQRGYMSAFGYDQMIRFSVQGFAGNDPTAAHNCQDNSLTGATAYGMSTTGATPAALGYRQAGVWPAFSIQGQLGLGTGLFTAQ